MHTATLFCTPLSCFIYCQAVMSTAQLFSYDTFLHSAMLLYSHIVLHSNYFTPSSIVFHTATLVSRIATLSHSMASLYTPQCHLHTRTSFHSLLHRFRHNNATSHNKILVHTPQHRLTHHNTVLLAETLFHSL